MPTSRAFMVVSYFQLVFSISILKMTILRQLGSTACMVLPIKKNGEAASLFDVVCIVVSCSFWLERDFCLAI